jgi:hypothetical protein
VHLHNSWLQMEPKVRQQDQRAEADDVSERACQHDQEADADSYNSTCIFSGPVTSESMQQIANVTSALGVTIAIPIFLIRKFFNVIHLCLSALCYFALLKRPHVETDVR